MKYCSACGNAMKDEAAFCPKCGTPVAVSNAPKNSPDTVPTPQTSKSKWHFSWEMVFAALSYVVGIPSLIALIVRKVQKKSTAFLAHHYIRALIINLSCIAILIVLLAVEHSPNFRMFDHTIADVTHGIQVSTVITTKYTVAGLIYTIVDRVATVSVFVLRLIGIIKAIMLRRWGRKRKSTADAVPDSDVNTCTSDLSMGDGHEADTGAV